MGIRVGTSGWSYKDWEGPVYPPGVKAADRLRFYAEHLVTTEVNSTFYRDPPASMVQGWIEKTRGVHPFELSVKGPKDLTQTLLAKGALADIRKRAKAWRRDVLDPLAKADRLGAAFLQLSPGVLHYPKSRERVAAALDALAPHRVAVEFRNRTWHTEEGRLKRDALAMLDERDAALVAVDGPSFPTILEGSADHAYLRFHGRNADVWLSNKPESNPEDPRMNRYDYLYDEEELKPWAKTISRLSEEKGEVRVYFNNHPGGQAFHDGQLLERLLARLHAPVEAAPQTTLETGARRR